MTGYVRELNEGVKRMFEEMERHGLPEPRYSVSDSSVKVTLYKFPEQRQDREAVNAQAGAIQARFGVDRLNQVFNLFKAEGRVSTLRLSRTLGVSDTTARQLMQTLQEYSLVRRDARGPKDPKAAWVLADSVLWDEIRG